MRIGCRRILGVVALAAVGVGLVGCSPVYAGVIGIQRLGDDLSIVVVTCPGHSLNAPVQLRHPPAGADTPRVEAHWEPGSGQSDGNSFPLGDRMQFVATLKSGDRYSLWAYNAPFSNEYIAGPIISPSAVAGLADGEILSYSYASDYVVVQTANQMLGATGSDLWMCNG